MTWMSMMTDQASVYLSPTLKPILMGLVMLCTFIVILDSTIAVVALPHMQAALGASPDSISWVLTSYITALAIGTPLTGWLGGRIGRRNLFIVSTIGFMLASALCGVATTLPLMVAARIIQGFAGAFIVPLSQAFMYDVNAPKDQVRAIMIWGMGSMVGPVLGPIFGGYLTDTFDWRWVFFINVPFGIVAGVGMMLMMPHFPRVRRPFDKIGFLLLAATLATVQLILDRGTSQDWFESPEILAECAIAVAAGWMFIVHTRRAPHPIVPGALFLDRNFTLAVVFAFALGGMNAAGASMVAPMVQNLFHYSVMDAGIVLAPRGGAMIFSMIAAGWMLPRMDLRIVVALGTVILAYGLWLTSGFSLVMGTWLLIWSSSIIGFGTGLAIMPINYLSGSTLPVELRTDCAAVYNLIRNLGASMLVAICSATLARNLQVNHAELSAGITSDRLPLAQPGIVEQLGFESGRIVAMIDAEINRQSLMIAYIDDFWMLSIALLCLIPLIVLISPPAVVRGKKADAAMMAE